ncbi:hypothetical protein NEF87_000131 [Candidatus Lokiarchaeum ossiferum]|uniref:4-vinyl reductase 4VR domain-containing protein n=1 Tax=Candidatus Lokiarchaeum ossiferum TaxID=2951803 RepID=A0ABY6HMQ5_9ARCH|nr:hypothetical protein NEF87_000131 [Candidatus Lokiarchaeum sp. B-35]
MDLKKELIGLRILFGSYFLETQKTWGESTVKALLNRLGQKPAEIVANQILEKYDKSLDDPFKIPSAAFSLFENTITKLFNSEVISQETLSDRIIIKIKNECTFRQTIKGRTELEYGGTLCEFTVGYFETALKMLTGLNVEYHIVKKETTDESCVINLVFYKKTENLKE